MKVKMKNLASGPQGSWHEGQIYDLKDEQAKAFIDGGYAVPLELVPELKIVEAAKPVVAASKSAEKPAVKVAANVSPTPK